MGFPKWEIGNQFWIFSQLRLDHWLRLDHNKPKLCYNRPKLGRAIRRKLLILLFYTMSQPFSFLCRSPASGLVLGFPAPFPCGACIAPRIIPPPVLARPCIAPAGACFYAGRYISRLNLSGLSGAVSGAFRLAGFCPALRCYSRRAAWHRAHMSYRLRPSDKAQAARHSLPVTRRMASHVIGKPPALARFMVAHCFEHRFAIGAAG
jgi:hypothetical protein